MLVTSVLCSSLGSHQEGALGMSGWLLVSLSAASLGTSAAPVQLAQADITTPSYAMPAMDPWSGYKVRLGALARQQGVRDATVRAVVPYLNLNQRVIDLDRAQQPTAASNSSLSAVIRAVSRPPHHHFADQPRSGALFDALGQFVADPGRHRRRPIGDHGDLRSRRRAMARSRAASTCSRRLRRLPTTAGDGASSRPNSSPP